MLQLPQAVRQPQSAERQLQFAVLQLPLAEKHPQRAALQLPDALRQLQPAVLQLFFAVLQVQRASRRISEFSNSGEVGAGLKSLPSLWNDPKLLLRLCVLMSHEIRFWTILRTMIAV